ncbi:hypothetical protein C8Q73DRAFT_155943 [Cubamyces lactineus]|nr:hypothetical protein C8Q73DRAFT_155943 [Cubamyces lactineus]
MPVNRMATKPAQHAWSGSGAWNTPLPFTESTSQTFGFDAKDVDARYPRLAYDLENIILGPMPVEEFMQAFLPVSAEVLKDIPSHLHAFDGIGVISKESDIYEPLVEALNPDPHTKRQARCPNFTFRITADNPDMSGGKVGAVKPDILCYAIEHLTEADLQRTDYRSTADMGFAATFIEIKAKDSSDHYSDPPDDADRNTHRLVLGRQGSQNTLSTTYEGIVHDLGQNVAYVVEIFARQHRCFCLSVSISGHTARLIRWDRSGAIVTRAFNYVTQPQLLCEFYWRFGSITDEARGYDLTVVPATDVEERLFLDTVTAHIKTQVDVSRPRTLSKCLEVHYLNGYVTAVQIPPTDGSARTRRFLVSRPVTFPRSVAASGTRAYWAVEVEVESAATEAQSAARGRICFLKDTWRLESAGAEIEGDILRDLSAKKVPNVPLPSFHGDVFDVVHTGVQSKQQTVTGNFLNTNWVCRPSVIRQHVHPRTHYRLVLDVVGFDLLHLCGTYELLHGAYDAFQAYQGAYKLANRLHRDIHPGNIVLFNAPDATTPLNFSSRKGYLVDWDHSCIIGGPQHKSTAYMPSLQWQFASESLLSMRRPSTKLHEFSDDLESILYTVLYCGALRIEHNMPYDTLVKWLNGMFDESSEVFSGGYSGGKGKRANKETRVFTEVVTWGCSHFKEWIDTIYDYLHPTSETPQDRRGKWTVEHVHHFWRPFLQRSQLQKTNRHDHIAKERSRLMRHAPTRALESPIQPTISAGSKRTAPTSSGDIEDPRPSKVARQDGQDGQPVRAASRSSSLVHQRQTRTGGRSGSAAKRTTISTMSAATAPPPSTVSATSSIAGPSRSRDIPPICFPTGQSPDPSELSLPHPPRGTQAVHASQRSPERFGVQTLPRARLSQTNASSEKVHRGKQSSRLDSLGERTGRNLCLMAYRATHGFATVTDEEFTSYWERLDPATREHFEEQARMNAAHVEREEFPG